MEPSRQQGADRALLRALRLLGLHVKAAHHYARELQVPAKQDS